MNDYWTEDANGVAAPSIDMLKGNPADYGAFRLSYYREWDFLYLRSPSNQSWATIPAGQVGWLLFDPQTLDIVGADVEDFEGLFLTSHPYLKVEWREVKQYVTITGKAIARGSILPPPLPDDRRVGGSVIEVIMGVMNCLTDPAHDA